MTPDLAKNLLHGMTRIRAVEEGIAARYPEQDMRCPTHLSIGQEGIMGLGAVLQRSDYAVSGHRAHAHYLAKGGDLRAMLAEIYGKAAGCAGGKGGSMHLIDEAAGFMGSTAIVGGTIPVGVGLGYAAKRDGKGQIACIFLGDAAVETGAFFESANFAVTKKLPVLFACENNLYSVYSPLSVRQPAGRRIHELAQAIGMDAVSIDGNDIEAVYQTALGCVDKLRAGSVPIFLEMTTYRWREHCGPNYDNDIGYRSEAEFLEWQKKDPITRFRDKALATQWLTPSDVAAIEAEVTAEVEAAFAYAKAAPFPPESDAFAHLYAEEGA